MRVNQLHHSDLVLHWRFNPLFSFYNRPSCQCGERPVRKQTKVILQICVTAYVHPAGYYGWLPALNLFLDFAKFCNSVSENASHTFFFCFHTAVCLETKVFFFLFTELSWSGLVITKENYFFLNKLKYLRHDLLRLDLSVK